MALSDQTHNRPSRCCDGTHSIASDAIQASRYVSLQGAMLVAMPKEQELGQAGQCTDSMGMQGKAHVHSAFH